MNEISVKIPASQTDLDAVRGLMRAFVDWAYERYASERAKVDGYFDRSAFEEELLGLPGKYGSPRGCLLMAEMGSVPVGCVAFRELAPSVCEMKRLFVEPAAHGRGIGRALVTRLIDEAKDAGYSAMRLDTGPGQAEAQGLYRSLGFKQIPPYYDLPEEIRSWLVFMELRLHP